VLRVRFGPPSRLAWWAVTAVVFLVVSEAIRRFTGPGEGRVIYYFVIVPVLGLAWFPTGYVLDRALTPRIRRRLRRT
jgi:hypothetical protein